VVTDPRSLHQKSNPNNGAMCMQLPFAVHLVGRGIASTLRVNHICMGQANVDAPLDSSMPPNHLKCLFTSYSDRALILPIISAPSVMGVLPQMHAF
jgi:hypothetical protein